MLVVRASCMRFAFALFYIFFSLGALSPSSRPQNIARTAFDLEGKPYDPFRHAAGKLIVLLFVRTDCSISNRYAPAIQELSSRFAKSTEFLLVYPVRSETPAQVRRHLSEYGYKLTALRDLDLRLVRAAEVKVTPEAAVFSADGRLLYHGRIDDWYADFGRSRPAPTTHELAAALEAATAGKPIAVAAVPAVGCFLPESP